MEHPKRLRLQDFLYSIPRTRLAEFKREDYGHRDAAPRATGLCFSWHILYLLIALLPDAHASHRLHLHHLTPWETVTTMPDHIDHTDHTEKIHRIESAIHQLRGNPAAVAKAHRAIRNSLQDLANLEPNASLSLADIFQAVATRGHPTVATVLGAVYIRLISYPEILPSSVLDTSRPHVVCLIEEACPDLVATLSLHKNAQNHQKIESFKMLHSIACQRLEILREPFTHLQALNARRPIIMRSLNYGPTQRYLNNFGFASVVSTVSTLLKLVDNAARSEGHALQRHTQDLLDSLADDLGQYQPVPTFLSQEYLLPFLNHLNRTATVLQEEMAGRFACTISAPVSPYRLQKKYPLHLAPSQIHIVVPLTNEGPGVAQDVRAYCLTPDGELPEIRLGDVQPGSFVLELGVTLAEPCDRLHLDVEVHWGIAGEVSKRTVQLSLTVLGQRTDLDWTSLSFQQPYSLEVAYDTEFYGRKDIVQRILRRLAPTRMQSCYITGQKRVGKSSLAHAVETRLIAHVHSGNYHVLYLECGEIRHSSGEDTLSALGTRLEEFLAGSLPSTAAWVPQDYTSSLRHLNRLLDQLRIQQPDTRFVMILDEFDEINESLYRHSELANTLFLNLRTLSSRKNMAFLLVGAERMPYVMTLQGEKLNKFDKESLDSFDLETEWSDFRDLVTGPVSTSITFHEPALRELFSLTNGHPYFTKLLCARLYELAVETKDAEVSVSEVTTAAQRVVAALDTNAFAHYWRDGIQGDADEVEIVSLNRCRLLVAWARTARSGRPLTPATIRSNVTSRRLSSSDVVPLLQDFHRRGIFREVDGVHCPAVDLFADWLREVGFSNLISDQLGDELADAKRQREDAAYVQSSEILEAAEAWDMYQGRRVTPEEIRAWLGQVDSHTDQRILFKVLQNVRFIKDLEAKEKFVHAHEWIRSRLPVPVKRSRAHRRDDIWVSYVDGAGKSGARFAALYAVANDVRASNVVSFDQLAVTLAPGQVERPVGVVVVDDFIGTGQSLVGNLTKVAGVAQAARLGTDIPLSVVVLCGTHEGERHVREYVGDTMPNADVEVGEILQERHFACGPKVGLWDTEQERSEAIALLTDLGRRVNKGKPLGFGDQGLLVTFSRNCPNNSLPILHGAGKGRNKWKPLFPRYIP